MAAKSRSILSPDSYCFELMFEFGPVAYPELATGSPFNTASVSLKDMIPKGLDCISQANIQSMHLVCEPPGYLQLCLYSLSGGNAVRHEPESPAPASAQTWVSYPIGSGAKPERFPIPLYIAQMCATTVPTSGSLFMCGKFKAGMAIQDNMLSKKDKGFSGHILVQFLLTRSVTTKPKPTAYAPNTADLIPGPPRSMFSSADPRYIEESMYITEGDLGVAGRSSYLPSTSSSSTTPRSLLPPTPTPGMYSISHPASSLPSPAPTSGGFYMSPT